MTLENREADGGREEDIEQSLANNLGSADPGWLAIGLGGLGEEGAAIAIVAAVVAATGYLAMKAGQWLKGLARSQGD